MQPLNNGRNASLIGPIVFSIFGEECHRGGAQVDRPTPPLRGAWSGSNSKRAAGSRITGTVRVPGSAAKGATTRGATTRVTTTGRTTAWGTTTRRATTVTGGAIASGVRGVHGQPWGSGWHRVGGLGHWDPRQLGLHPVKVGALCPNGRHGALELSNRSGQRGHHPIEPCERSFQTFNPG